MWLTMEQDVKQVVLRLSVFIQIIVALMVLNVSILINLIKNFDLGDFLHSRELAHYQRYLYHSLRTSVLWK